MVRETRDLGLDAARGLALMSMFVAHFAPSPGPASVLTLSEHLTAFMFVLLIGCGAELGRHSSSQWRSSQVRSAALIGLGLVLTQLPSGIVVVLVWLGVMTLISVWMSQLMTWTVAFIGLVAAIASPFLMDSAREWLHTSPRDPISAGAADLFVAGDSYRVVALVLPACVGILLVRHASSDRRRLGVSAAALPLVVVLYLADQIKLFSVEAYTGSVQEIFFNTAIALVATCVTWVVAPRIRYVGAALAGAGAMALTVYVLQVIGDWAYYRSGGADDNQWSILVGACAAAVLLGVGWKPIEHRIGWRGLLEGPIDRLAQAKSSAPATACRPSDRNVRRTHRLRRP